MSDEESLIIEPGDRYEFEGHEEATSGNSSLILLPGETYEFFEGIEGNIEGREENGEGFNRIYSTAEPGTMWSGPRLAKVPVEEEDMLTGVNTSIRPHYDVINGRGNIRLIGALDQLPDDFNDVIIMIGSDNGAGESVGKVPSKDNPETWKNFFAHIFDSQKDGYLNDLLEWITVENPLDGDYITKKDVSGVDYENDEEFLAGRVHGESYRVDGGTRELPFIPGSGWIDLNLNFDGKNLVFEAKYRSDNDEEVKGFRYLMDPDKLAESLYNPDSDGLPSELHEGNFHLGEAGLKIDQVADDEKQETMVDFTRPQYETVDST